MGGIFELSDNANKRRYRGALRHGAALLLLASCGAAAPQDMCERLGLLCSDRDEVVRLGLADAKNATADLDGDGRLDLVTAAPGGSLSIGWGGTGQREYRLVKGGVADVEIADVDGDGDQDVVYATIDPAALRVLDNVGGRKLPEGRSMAVTGRAQSLWVGALDEDGSPDAVVASLDGLTVFTQGLAHSRQIAVGIGIAEVQAGDLNGDDRGDIVAIDHDDGAFWVVQAEGDGFAAPRRIATGADPRYLELYDLDGDGSLDALTHGSTKREIWLHAGDGAGGFAAARGLVVQDAPSPGFGAHRDAAGDRWLLTIEDDRVLAHQLGADDRVVGRVLGSAAALARRLDVDGGSMISHGDFRTLRYALEPAQMFVERWHGGKNSLQRPVFGDFDLDGVLESVAIEDDYHVVIRRQLPDGQWGLYSSFDMPAFTVSMAVADATGDGRPDLVLGAGMSLYVAIGRGDGSFELGPPAPLTVDPWLLHAGFDPAGDGGVAVAVANDGPLQPGVFVLHFDAEGLVKEQAQPISDGSGVQLSSADVDRDGRDDLVAVVATEAEYALAIVPAVDGGWGPPQLRSLSALLPDGNIEAAALVVGDIDLDETVDALLVDRDTIVRLLDIGAAVPPPPQTTQVDGLWSSEVAAIAEVDGDGRLDLIHCSSSALGIILDIAGAELQAQPPVRLSGAECSLHVDPEDLRATAGTITDRGLSVFTPALVPSLDPTDSQVGSAGAPRRLATGDIDADGYTDVVVSDDGSHVLAGFAVLWGRPDGPAQRGLLQEVYYGSEVEIVVAPVDARPGDEVVAVWAGGKVTVWTHRDGALELMLEGQVMIWNIIAVDLQARRESSSDIIVLDRLDPEQLQVVATAPGTDGTSLDGRVVLYAGAAGTGAAGITTADFDLDGYEDLAIYPGRGQPVELRWGNRERVPITGSIAVDPNSIYRITSADMDADGAPELILGTGAGALSIGFDGRSPRGPVSLTTDPFETELVIADMEGDGVPDLLRPDYNGVSVVLRGLAGDMRTWLPFHFNPWSQVHAAPLDDDGILDLIGLRDGDLVMRRSAAPP